jgi:cobalt-zinc-cadmium efflux system protein
VLKVLEGTAFPSSTLSTSSTSSTFLLLTHHHHGTHPHTHSDARDQMRRLRIALVITATFLLAEVAGGILSNSLALLADAGHMLTDAAGVAIALVAATLAARPATDTRTFGLLRAEVLAAAGNALLLGGLGVWVVVEAIGRWDEPPEISTGLMLAVAALGAVANLASLLVLSGGRSESLNVRGAYLEVLGDLVGSLAVILAGLVIVTTGYTRADVIASVAIGLFILPRAWSLLREVVDVLLEATPRGIDLTTVREHVTAVRGVVDVHDLHAWTITSGTPALSAHVVVDQQCIDRGEYGRVLDDLADCLAGHFDTTHCTFQLEPAGHGARETGQHR